MKRCDKVPEEQLLAYHLNALTPLRKLQLTWHLKDCADCQAGLQAEQALDSRLYRGENLTRSLPTSTPSRQLALRLGGAALALTGLVIGGVLLRPGTPGGPQIAFADVEKALSDSRYITWQETQTYDWTRVSTKIVPAKRQRSTNYRTDYFVEVKPLRMVLQQNPLGYRLLYDVDHMESTSGNSEYSWSKLRDSHQFVSIKQLILSPLDANYPDPPPAGPFQTKSTPWQKKTVTFQGKPAIHFARTTTILLTSEVCKDTRKEQIWVEPSTRHLLRREFSTEDTIGAKIVSVANNFQYVDTVPRGTFDPIRPKQGEAYTFTDHLGPERKLLVENTGTDKSIQKQVGQIVSAMNSGDGAQLAILGDAKLYAGDGPEVIYGKSRAQRAAYLRWYLKYIGQQRVLRNWKIDRLPGHFTSVLARWHRHEEGAAYPPTGPMEVNVPLSGTATLSNGKRQKVRSFAKFRLTPTGPKLIWFNPNNHN